MSTYESYLIYVVSSAFLLSLNVASSSSRTVTLWTIPSLETQFWSSSGPLLISACPTQTAAPVACAYTSKITWLSPLHLTRGFISLNCPSATTVLCLQTSWRLERLNFSYVVFIIMIVKSVSVRFCTLFNRSPLWGRSLRFFKQM